MSNSLSRRSMVRFHNATKARGLQEVGNTGRIANIINNDAGHGILGHLCTIIERVLVLRFHTGVSRIPPSLFKFQMSDSVGLTRHVCDYDIYTIVSLCLHTVASSLPHTDKVRHTVGSSRTSDGRSDAPFALSHTCN